MKKLLSVMLAVLMACSINSYCLTAFAAVRGEAIVVLEDNAPESLMKKSRASSVYGEGTRLEEAFTFSSKAEADEVNVAYLKSTKLSDKELVKKLKKNPNVKYAFRNTKKKALDITNDEYSKYQWALENNAQNGGKKGSDVNPEGLWEKAASSDKEQIVAVVDTGLDLEHPDFEGKIWENTHGRKLSGKNGFNFVYDEDEPQDDNGHGTHCAGIIAAAADNTEGISGINKSNVKIMPLKWLDSEGSGSTEDVIAAYDYISRAIDLGENIVAINNSWGGGGDADERDAFREIFDNLGKKGAISLVAAGNDGMELTEDGYEDFFFGDTVYDIPTSSMSPYQINVAASNESDELASFSNYSSTMVDVAAPGTDILSSVSYNCFNPSIYSDEQKSKLVSSMQDYNEPLAEGDFGFPHMVDFSESENADEYSTNAEIIQSDSDLFGTTGKGLVITTKDGAKIYDEDEDTEEDPDFDDEDDFSGDVVRYCFEIPYTLDNLNGDYSISFMFRANKNIYGSYYDVPSSYNVVNKIDDMIDNYQVDELYGEDGCNYWDHIYFNFDEFTRDTFKKSKNRKLVFVFAVEEADTEIVFDDFAISKAGVEYDDFGKYDFYNGTSMATPYVAGAVALLKNAFPEANNVDVINMIVNAGRKSDELEYMVKSGRVLSLKNPDRIPPMIFSASYNDEGNVSISGSFNDITKVTVNGKKVTPISSDLHEIVIPDNNYSTNKFEVNVKNNYGDYTYSNAVSDKTLIPEATDVTGAPSNPVGGFMVPTGDKAVYINAHCKLGVVSRNSDSYVYDEEKAPQFDMKKLFGSNNVSASPDSAVYCNGKLYAVIINSIVSANGKIIGYETAFASLDLSSGETQKLCELPEEILSGSSLGAYNGEIFLIGGMDTETGEIFDSVYKYDAEKAELVKTESSLPQGRAYAKFLQYGDKLYGFFGAVDKEEFPCVLTFDGKEWKADELKVECDDNNYIYSDDDKDVISYEGNVGYGKDGFFLSGAYIYGYGDAYEYNVNDKSLVDSEYNINNSLDGKTLAGTTLPGCYIGFEQIVEEPEVDDIILFGRGNKSARSASSSETSSTNDGSDAKIYKASIETNYSKLDSSAVKNASVSATNFNSIYGNDVTVSVTPDNGYKLVGFKVDGTAANESATLRATAPVIKVEATVQAIPSNQNGSNDNSNKANNSNSTAANNVLKLGRVKAKKAKVKKKKAILKWKKVKNAKGYQIQQYKKGKWKTVKTTKKAKVLKFKTKKLKAKGKVKFRIRAYANSNGKKVYGKWSKVIKVKLG